MTEWRRCLDLSCGNLGKHHRGTVFFSILHEIITARTFWTKLTTNEKAAYLANCGQGSGPLGLTPHLSKGCQTKSGRRRLLLKVDECRMCACGMMRSEERDHTLACPKNPWGPRIHDRVRDSLAKQLRRMGATVDLERVAPQWSKKNKHNEGSDEYRVARIDVVATIPGSDELQWLDVTIGRPTAAAIVEGGARNGTQI